MISAHRSNRTNKSQNFEALRNSVTQNDFSRDIKNIVYKDLIVKKKVGAQEEGLNIIEKVNKMINGQNPSMISASQMSKKKSLLKSVK